MKGVGDVVADPRRAFGVLGERAQQRLYVGSLRLRDLRPGLVDGEVPAQQRRRGRSCDGDRVAHRATVHLNDLLKACRRYGVAVRLSHAACRGRPETAVERDGWYVVTLVDDDKPISGEELGVDLLVPSGELLDRG